MCKAATASRVGQTVHAGPGAFLGLPDGPEVSHRGSAPTTHSECRADRSRLRIDRHDAPSRRRAVSPVPTCRQALRAFADQPGLVLLDSALLREPVGRYSFLAADPFERVILQRAAFGADPFEQLADGFARIREPSRSPALPPFQGGAAGLFSYELGGAFERIPRAAIDEFELPDLAVGFYDWVIAWDHRQQRAWIISHGFAGRRRERSLAARRTDACVSFKRGSNLGDRTRRCRSARRANRFRGRRIGTPVRGPGARWSDEQFFPRRIPRAPVRRTIEYIHAGDIFQANLSQRLLYPPTHRSDRIGAAAATTRIRPRWPVSLL